MDPLERLGWRVCADQLPAEARDAAVERLELELPGLRQRGESRMLAHLLMCLSVHHMFRGDPDRARTLLDEAIVVPGGERWPRTRISVLQMEATWWMHHADPVRAVEALVLMRRQARASGLVSFEIKASLNLAYQLSALGDAAEARHMLDQAAALAREHGQARRLGEVRAAEMMLAIERGDLPGAAVAGQAFLALPQSGDGGVDGRARAVHRLCMGILAVRAGQLEAGVEAAEVAAADSHTGLAPDRALIDYIHGMAGLAQGEHRVARAHLRHARTQLQQSIQLPRQAMLDGLEARLLIAEGRAEDAVALIERGSRGRALGSSIQRAVERVLSDRDAARAEELRSDNEALRRLHRSESEARAAAERAAQARHRFLSTMSHEIRTPLNGVMATVELLERAHLGPQQAGLVQVLRRSGELTLQILEDILELGRLESGRVAIEWRDFPLLDPVEHVLAMLASKALHRRIDLVLDAEQGLPEHVRGDARRLEQVVLNLVSNALRFTGPGRVEVRVRRAEGGRLRFAVIDDGMGIPEDERERLFAADDGPGSTVRGQAEGGGLGLSISRGIVTLHGGEMGVDSARGEGTCFWFELPLPEARAPSPLPSEAGAVPLAGRSVLLVEDNPTNRELARLLLQQFGAEVVAVDDGDEAVPVALERPFDLILMDVHMPRMDGLEATRQLRRAGYPGPIVALTASALAEDRAAATAAGMNGFATKPIRVRRLMAVLAEAMAGDAPAPPSG